MDVSSAILYRAPILVSWLITVGLGLLAYLRRRVTGALPLAIAIGLEAEWIGGYVLGLLSPTLEGKIFWENVQYIGTLFTPLMILVFATAYCGRQPAGGWKLWAGLALPGGLVFILALTNPWHGWAVHNQRLIPGEPFDFYGYDFGIPVYAGLLYNYGLLLRAIYLLAGHWRRQTGVARRQAGFVLVGIVIPVVSSLTIFVDLSFLPQRDISPYYFAIANLFIAQGLFHYRLFDVVLFARDLVMENMEDGVLVVDPLGRLLDINPAATAMLGVAGRQPIGQPLASLLPDWLKPIELDQTAPAVRPGPALERVGASTAIAVQITRLVDKAAVFSGHMLILRDITERRRAEAELRASELRHRQLADELQQLNSQLEDRVADRTAALARANAALSASETRLRRIADNMLDMIAQVDASGRYEYVSPSHQAVLGYAANELTGRSLADFVHPEDAAPALRAIQLGVSTSIQLRARPAGGHYVWLESVSNPLRDAAGRVIGAILSSRNITQRRQVEQRAAAFSELGYQLSAAETAEAAAAIIAAIADSLLGWDVCFLDLYLAERDLLRSVVFLDTLADGRRLSLAADLPAYPPTATTRRVMAEGPLLILRDGPEPLIPGMTYWGDASRHPGSLMFVPIRNGAEFLGLLSIQSYRDQAYDAAALQTLQALADHCGSTLERIRAEADVRASLREKEVMLQEIHHRVKNNLQVVSSLLNLQASRVADRQAQDVLRDSQNRVRSMALVHEKLYRSPDLARIDLAEYTRSLVSQLRRTYTEEAGRIALRVEAAGCQVGIDTSIACGLILNELVSNALKHAFPGDRAGEIVVELQAAGPERRVLRVADDGVGFPPESE